MLQVNYNGIAVTAMRPDAPVSTFGSDDVPHGTDSVIYKAALVLNQNHQANLPLPRFTEDQVKARVESQKAKLSFVDTSLDDDGNPVETLDTSIAFHLQTKLMPPTEKEVKEKFDALRGFSDADVQKYIQENSKPLIKTPAVKDMEGKIITPEVITQQEVIITEEQAKTALFKPQASLSGAGPMFAAPQMPTLQQAEAAKKEEMLQALAESQVKFLIDQCLEVPELKPEFKDLFELREIEDRM